MPVTRARRVRPPAGRPGQACPKPVSARALHVPPPPSPAAGLARATRILVVEDEPDIGGLIKHALERDGQTSVELVGTGDAALAAIAERPPDLVVLDLNLPVLSRLRGVPHPARRARPRGTCRSSW